MQFNEVEIIKNSLSMRDVVEWYGYVINKSGFINCPFHLEKTPSMKIFEKDYHCFGCGEHGDVISFVQKLFELTFNEALIKIDNDFNLHLFGEKTFAQAKMLHYKQKIYKAKKERLKATKEIEENKYWNTFDEWKRLYDNKKKYAPKTENEELHPLFIEALQKLTHQEYLLDLAEMRRCNCE